MKPWVRRILTALTLSLAPVLLFAGAANAGIAQNSGAYGTSFVDGGGTLKDDWNENFNELGHSLCKGCSDSNGTDLVVLWQTILYSEGLISKGSIDGYFGSTTALATRVLQTRYGIDDDGYVGDTTWLYAGNRLHWWVLNGVTYVQYDATQGWGWAEFTRGSTSNDYDGGAYAMHRAKGSSSGSTPFNFGNSSSTPRINFYKRTIVKM